MPPGIAPTELQLSRRQWATTSNMQTVRSGDRAAAFRYAGTGAVVQNEAATLRIPVTPGTVYVFSAHAEDRSKAGEVDLIVDSDDGKSTYVSRFVKAPVSSQLSTPPWKAPPGVTSVLVGMQIVQSPVDKGVDVTFSQPVLLSATPSDNR